MRLGLAILALLAHACLGQATPPTCFQFNDPGFAGTLSTAYAPDSNGSLYVHFTAPIAATIDRIDVWAGACLLCPPHGVSFALFQTPFLGAQPAAFLGSYSGDLGQYAPDGWIPLPAINAASLSSGSTYVLLILASTVLGPPTGTPCRYIPHDPSGAVQLPYQFVGTSACPGPWVPPFPASGTLGLMLRFRGASCNGPLANVSVIGSGCGAAPTAQAGLLNSYDLPILGASWSVTTWGAVNGTAMLFWSGGVNPTGSPMVPGSSCLFYLDQASLGYLASLGAEPLVTATLQPYPASNYGWASWTFPVPPFPVYAGLVIGVQVAIISPLNTIPLGGGAFFQVTNALKLTLGY